MIMDEFKNILNNEVKKRELGVSGFQIEKMFEHFRLLLQWQKTYNLTSITNIKESVYKHYLDCILGLNDVELQKEIFDIGTGGGFPGIVAAILRPEHKFILLESVRKKCSFLLEVKKSLHLKNIEILNDRLEHIQPFSYGITRAAFSIDKIDSIASKIKEKGHLIVFLGPQDSAQKNINHLKYFNVHKIYSYTIAEAIENQQSGYMRSVVDLEKK